MDTAGQIVRVVEVRVPGGPWQLAVEVVTPSGPVIGTLFAPPNAAEGAIMFRPAPELQEAAATPTPRDAPSAGAAVPPEGPPSPAAVAGAGPLTTEVVPSTGPAGAVTPGPSPDDPRGLQRGRRR